LKIRAVEFDNFEVEIINYLLRAAIESDALKIRDLIHLVGINPMDLNWKHFLIAETPGGDFVGCAQLKPHKDGSVELASLAVKDKHRGEGIARALIEKLLTLSSRPLYLMCRPELGIFYERFGFRIIGADVMPPYFRRMVRVIKVMIFLARREGPLIMRLD
jgi:N-acetylglutamate synthase-like GNAT family acetyltransferase